MVIEYLIGDHNVTGLILIWVGKNLLLRPRTHGNVFLRFCIVYCSQGNQEQPAHYFKQYKNVGKRFHVYEALITKLHVTFNIHNAIFLLAQL